MAGFLTLPATRAGSGGNLALPPLPARVFSFCLVFGVLGLYFTWCWSGGRRTLPMKTWRMALVRTDGRTVDAKAAVLRYLAAWIGPLAAALAYGLLHPLNLGAHAGWWLTVGWLWPILDPQRQFLHDRIAGTRIVMAPAHPSSAGRAPPPR